MSADVLENMIEIELPTDDSFNIVRETLTRMGVKHNKEQKLYQSAHILHKRGRFYICHFKEMFILDGKPSTITEDDIGRRNTIADLLQEWGLIKILNEDVMDVFLHMNQIKIIPFQEKAKWELIPKYTIGSKKHEKEDTAK